MSIKKLSNGYLVDVQPGGREGRRVRRVFLTKELAQTFERKAYIEQESMGVERGLSLPVCELIDRFTNEYARLRFRGFKDEQYRLKYIREFFEKANKPINTVRLTDGEAFIRSRISDGMKPGTINRDINTLKRIFSWAVEHNYLPYSPFDKKLKHLKGAASRVRWLTEAEVKSLLAAAKQIDPALEEFIFFGVETGLRLTNLLDLEASHIGLEFVTALKTKSGKPYDVPLSSALKERLPEFLNRQGKLLKPKDLGRSFRDLVKAAGLYTNANDSMKVTIHTLRHTFASRWLQRGVPIYTVSKWLGHSSVKMTEQVYGHLSKSHHVTEMRQAELRLIVVNIQDPNGGSNESNSRPTNP